MKFISWNVNGFRACLTKGFEDFFNNADADIFCLQETKMQPEQMTFNPDGYYTYMNSAVKKGYSGTAVFTKKEPLSVAYGINGEHNDEGRVITLEYDNFYFVTCYVPNAQSELARLPYRMEFEDAMRGYLSDLDKVKPVVYCGDLKEAHPSYISTTKRKPVIYCGDLNVAANPIDIKNPKANEQNPGYSIEERTAFKKLLDSGFVDSFRYLYPDQKDAYSWWSYRFNARAKNIGWRLDYFLVSDFAKDKIIDSKILTDVMGSDHCPVSLQMDI